MTATLSTGGIILVGIVAIGLLSRLLATALRRMRQPVVVAEIAAGVVLGAGVLGRLPGDLSATLYPHDATRLLSLLGQAALVAYLPTIVIRAPEQSSEAASRRAVMFVAALSFAVPFLLGLGLAVAIHPAFDRVGGAAVALVPFALFVATAIAVTAFPVLARIVEDRGLSRLRSGRVALAAAGVQELLIWPLVALACALASDGDLGRVAVRSLAALLAVAVAARTVAPLAVRATVLLRVPLLLALLAGCALATDRAGLHIVLGAFLFATLLRPRERAALAAAVSIRAVRGLVAAGLPVFFALPAMNLRPGELVGDQLGLLLVTLLLAVAGKAGGAALGARLAGSPWREAGILGVLMNTRGLVELVVLTVGLTAGILDGALYSVLIAVAVITTVMTGPLVDRLARRRLPLAAPVPA